MVRSLIVLDPLVSGSDDGGLARMDRNVLNPMELRQG
jgi:hypothetical protein